MVIGGVIIAKKTNIGSVIISSLGALGTQTGQAITAPFGGILQGINLGGQGLFQQIAAINNSLRGLVGLAPGPIPQITQPPSLPGTIGTLTNPITGQPIFTPPVTQAAPYAGPTSPPTNPVNNTPYGTPLPAQTTVTTPFGTLTQNQVTSLTKNTGLSLTTLLKQAMLVNKNPGLTTYDINGRPTFGTGINIIRTSTR